VATGEILGKNETSLQQVLSGNDIKQSVLCAFVACFIVNCEMNKKTWAVQNFARNFSHLLQEIILRAFTRPISRLLPLALTFASGSGIVYDLTLVRLGIGYELRKVFRIGTVRYHWPMSAHASQAFSIASCTDSEDLPEWT